jgi:hypothetical protein
VKLKSTRGRPAAPLAPDCIYHLMIGESAGVRLRGWPDWFQSWRDEASLNALLDAAWTAHGTSLTAEAARHGFQPFYATRQAPTASDVEAWAAAFIAAHRY